MKSKIMKVLTVAMILAMSMVLSFQSEKNQINVAYALKMEQLTLERDGGTPGWKGNFWGTCCKCGGKSCKASKMCRKQ
jgi:ABC-type uncharacterized transport system substrate-binding protein